MNYWEDKGEFWEIHYVTHEKIPLRGFYSVRKGPISVKEFDSIHHFGFFDNCLYDNIK